MGAVMRGKNYCCEAQGGTKLREQPTRTDIGGAADPALAKGAIRRMAREQGAVGSAHLDASGLGPDQGTRHHYRRGRADRRVDCWVFFGRCLFVFQAAFVKPRNSRSTSLGVRYPRAG